MTDSCFQLKGSVVSVVVLELHHYSPTRFASEIEQRIQRAPQLLQGSPVVINVEKCGNDVADIDFEGLLRICREHGLQPFGFRSCEGFNDALRETGLALLPASSSRHGGALRQSGTRADTPQPATPDASPSAAARPSKLVTQPVRSGQQVYARDSDLIIMSQVSEGAEVLADGNIHVYGGLRGRALAGVSGNTAARIFCHSLEAELLSVAGNFMLSEDFRAQQWKQPVQVFLEAENLRIETL